MKIILIILFSFNAFCVETFIGCEHTTTEPINLAWDGSPDSEFYELKARWVDVTPNIEYDLGRYTVTEATVSLPRSGHFIILLRSGRWDDTQQIEVFSVWIESIDATYSSVNGGPMGWRVNKRLDAPQW